MKKITNIGSQNLKILVNAKATYFPDSVRVYIPNKPYFKIKEGFEYKKSKLVKITDSEEELDF